MEPGAGEEQHGSAGEEVSMSTCQELHSKCAVPVRALPPPLYPEGTFWICRRDHAPWTRKLGTPAALLEKDLHLTAQECLTIFSFHRGRFSEQMLLSAGWDLNIAVLCSCMRTCIWHGAGVCLFALFSFFGKENCDKINKWWAASKI